MALKAEVNKMSYI